MQVEERIRRAEEIYNSRRAQNSIRVSTGIQKDKKEYGLFKKVFIQIIICLLIYFIFYMIKNSDYIFSESVIRQTKEFLSYDINFEELYSNVKEYYNDNIKKLFESNYLTGNETEKINSVENKVDENDSNNINNSLNEYEEKKSNVNVNEIGIGGGEDEKIKEEIENEISNEEEETKELTQMEIDANEIKNNYSLIVPLEGIISSRFGPRTPTGIVSANHAGIDIAVDEGTVFNASMEGTVTYVSSEGGYGNHFLIQKDDVITLYAHCSEIYVNEGDYINQGQEIGEVGSTGNATGPHLHFEIRKDDRVVDPELILEF